MATLVAYLRTYEDACFDRNYKYSLHGRYRKPKRKAEAAEEQVPLGNE